MICKQVNVFRPLFHPLGPPALHTHQAHLVYSVVIKQIINQSLLYY